ncbi:MAG TPA: S8 family serine peptidase, partial [Saprospiraceae bacterium]|nr:S8 family serine peptidase [Saprospiraceae bacterium]
MKKLPAEYRSLLRKKERQRQGDLESVSKTAAAPDEVGIQFEFQGSLEPLRALGLKITSQEGRFAGGIIALDQLAALAAHPNIVRIEKPERDKKRLNKSIPDVRANLVWSRSGDVFSGNSGKDTIIGIVDTGIDYIHKTFRKADNTSRILFLWDQTIEADDDNAVLGEDAPGTITTPGGDVDLDYGVEFVREDEDDDERPTLNKALASSDPYEVVRHKDMDGHGTHVAGIAAGDGSQSDACCGAYTYIGVAPEADLIIVRKLGLTDGDPDSTHTTNSKIDAIRYILNRANGRPCVINLSLGRDIGARDGSGVTEQRVDSILASFPQGVAICQSSGNEANDNIHAQGDVPANNTAEIVFKVKQDSSQILRVELWYSGNHLEAAVKPPGVTFADGDWQWVSPGNDEDDLGYNGDGEVALENEENRIRVTLTPPTEGHNVSGKWTFRLRNNTGDDAPVHIWCDAGIVFKNPADEDAPLHVTIHSTINPEASAKNVIVVGAYAAEGSQSGHLAGFSSRGPALDPNVTDEENIRPHISAPGVSITSAATAKYRSDELLDAICCCDCCQDFYIDENGTSMATPHVTGAVALMLQKNPTLSFE